MKPQVFIVTAALLLTACSSDPVDVNARASLTPGWGQTTPLARGNDGTIYFGYVDPYGRVGALAALGPDGSERWRTRFGGTPIVGPDGVIYSHDGNMLNAMQPNGEVLWRAEAYGQMGLAGDGTVYTVAQLDDQVTTDQTTLTAVAADGRVAWQTSLWGAPVARPVVTGRGTVLVATVDLTGAQQLQSFTRRGVLQWAVPLGALQISGSPGALALDADDTIYIGSSEGMHALRPEDGARLWTVAVEGGARSPILGPDGTVYARAGNGYGGVVAIAGQAVKWHQNSIGAAGMALGADGRLYVCGTLEVSGSTRWRLFAINAADGAIETEYGYTRVSGFTGAPAIGNGTVYTAGYIFHYKPEVTEYPNDVTYRTLSLGFEGVLELWDTTAGGLADSPWPRDLADNGNSGLHRHFRTAVPQQKAELEGYWAAEVAGEQHVLRFAHGIEGPALGGIEWAYELYRYPVDKLPIVVEQGTYDIKDDTLVLAPLAGGEPHVSALQASTAWELRVVDPLDGQARAFRSWQLPPLKPLPGGETRWTFADGALNGPLYEWVDGLSVGPDGAVMVLGTTEQNLDFQNKTTQIDGKYDAFIARFDAQGWVGFDTWSTPGGGNAGDRARRMIGDGAGGGVAVGAALPGGNHVAVLGSDGQVVSAFPLTDLSPWDVAVRADGDLIVVGDGPAGLGVQRVRRDGTPVWSRQPGSTPAGSAAAVAIDGSGHIVVAGYVMGAVDFGTGPVEAWTEAHPDPAKAYNLLLLKMTPDGETVWARTFPGWRRDTWSQRLTVGLDGGGAIVVAGDLQNPLNVGFGVMKPDDDPTDGFVARFDASGEPEWSLQIGDPDVGDSVTSILVHESGNVAIGGSFGPKMRIGGELHRTRGTGWFLLELDRCGGVLWKKAQHQGGLDVRALARTPDGAIAAAGIGAGWVDVGDGFVSWAWKVPNGFGVIGGPWVGVFEETGDAALGDDGNPRSCDAKGATSEHLEVTVSGSGVGQVVSDPPGIACPGTCSAPFPGLSKVTLSAQAEKGSRFIQWTGACSGTEPQCTVAVAGKTAVTATFERPAPHWVSSWDGQEPPSGLAVLNGGRIAMTHRLSGAQLTVVEPDGTPAWALSVADEPFGGVAAAPGGGVLVSGYRFQSSVNLGGSDLDAPGELLYAAMLDADGGHLWSRSYWTNPAAAPQIAAAPSGAFVMAGGGSTWLDDEGDLLYLEASDHYVVRLGSNGAPQWFRSILRATDLRVATAGEDTILLLHPSGVGPMTLGLGDYSSAGPALVSLDPSGDERFVVELTSGQALATSKDGTIAVLSPGAPGNATLFDATGQMVWSAPLLTATAGLYGVRAAFDAAGPLVVVGTVSEPKPLPGAPDTGNLGIVSLDAGGGLLSAGNVGYGAPAEALIQPTAAALTPDGDLVVGGKVSGGADLGNGALTATPYSAFLVRYSP